MLRFTTHDSLRPKRQLTTKHAGIITAVLAAVLVSTLVLGFQPSNTQASPIKRICLATADGCADLLPIATNTQTSSSRPLQPAIRSSITLEVTLTRRLLHISGANFAPGKAVRIAVVHVSNWASIWTGPIYAQPALMDCTYPYLQDGCGQANPHAGTIDYTVRLSHRYGASALVVLYHAARQTGSATVKIK